MREDHNIDNVAAIDEFLVKETTNNKLWKAVARRSLKGGIISLDHFSVYEKCELVIIKAGIFRLLKRLALVLVVASLVVGMMLYLGIEDGSDDEGRIAECYFLLFMILLCFVYEIFAFFRSGRVELDKKSGNIRIRHGLFFRRRREVSIPKEELKVRLYQNRQGGRDRDIGWGYLVLSLERVDDSSEELILCKSKAKRIIKEPFEIIQRYLGQGEMVGVDDFIKQETLKQPCTANPQWHQLAIRSRTKGPLLGHIKPRTTKVGNEFHVCRSPIGMPIGLGCVLLGAIALGIFIVGLSAVNAFLGIIVIVFVIGFIAVSYCILCRVERVSIDQLQSRIRIRDGILFFDRKMEYCLNKIKVKFYRSDQNDTCATVRTGDTVFSIIHKYAPEDKLILYKSTDAEHMHSLHDAINKAMGISIKNEAEESFKLPDGKVIRVSKSSAFNWNEKLSIKRSILQSAPEQFIMKRDVSWKNIAFWFLVTPLLFVLAIFFVIAASPEGEFGKFIFITGSLLVLLFGGMIVCRYALEYWGQMYLVADRSDKRVYYQFRKDGGKTSVICGFEEICAVQLCMSYQSEPDKNNGNPFAVFEMNLVVGEPDVRRIPVAVGEDEHQMRTYGNKFAMFFNIPLIDHI
jgi:membrane protein YdbS with pleckstrin-like domain